MATPGVLRGFGLHVPRDPELARSDRRAAAAGGYAVAQELLPQIPDL